VWRLSAQRLACSSESLWRKCVADYEKLVSRETLRGETICRGLRVAHDGITPAEGRDLCTELSRRKQIPKLALTADNHGHAGEASHWNQSQISIEIEGMSNLDLAVPQESAEAPTGTNGCPAEKAAAKPELGNFTESLGERAASPDAAQAKPESIGREILSQHAELALRATCLERVGH